MLKNYINNKKNSKKCPFLSKTYELNFKNAIKALFLVHHFICHNDAEKCIWFEQPVDEIFKKTHVKFDLLICQFDAKFHIATEPLYFEIWK